MPVYQWKQSDFEALRDLEHQVAKGKKTWSDVEKALKHTGADQKFLKDNYETRCIEENNKRKQRAAETTKNALQLQKEMNNRTPEEAARAKNAAALANAALKRSDSTLSDLNVKSFAKLSLKDDEPVKSGSKRGASPAATDRAAKKAAAAKKETTSSPRHASSSQVKAPPSPPRPSSSKPPPNPEAPDQSGRVTRSKAKPSSSSAADLAKTVAKTEVKKPAAKKAAPSNTGTKKGSKGKGKAKKDSSDDEVQDCIVVKGSGSHRA